MKRGRKPIAEYVAKEMHINEMATTATNLGAYTVESLVPGICYFIEGDVFVLASATGFMKLHLTTAEAIAKELADILAGYKTDKRSGLVPMSTKDIQKMLEL